MSCHVMLVVWFPHPGGNPSYIAQVGNIYLPFAQRKVAIITVDHEVGIDGLPEL